MLANSFIYSAPHHRSQMGVLVGDGLMPVDPTPRRNRRQRSGVTILCRYLPHHILARPRLAPDVGEASADPPCQHKGIIGGGGWPRSA